MEMPIAIARSSLRMLERIQAEESLDAVQRNAIGSGNYPSDEAKRAIAVWSRASSDIPASAAKPLKAADDDLAGLGIGVTRVKRGH